MTKHSWHAKWHIYLSERAVKYALQYPARNEDDPHTSYERYYHALQRNYLCRHYLALSEKLQLLAREAVLSVRQTGRLK